MFCRLLLIPLLCWAFLWADAGQNSFYFKDGKSEKGQILAEFENHFLVKTADGKIVEITKSELAKMIKSDGKILKAKDIVAGKARNTAGETSPAAKTEEPRITEISVTSRPESADVSIDGEKKGTSPLHGIEVEPGEHIITVSRAGFEQQEKKISMKTGKKTEVRFKLKAKPKAVEKKQEVFEAETFLEVETKPESAQVWIDGKEKGFTPLKQVEIEPGEHAIVIRLDGFVQQEKKVVAKQGKETKIQFKLKRAPKPEPASDTAVAVTNDRQMEKPAAVEATPAPTLPDSPLPPLNGYLSVSSKPAGALVFLDEIEAGNTPLNRLATEGPHQVKLTLEGYTGASYPVNVIGGKTAKLNVKLYRTDPGPEKDADDRSIGLSILRWSIGAIVVSAIPASGYYAWKAETDFRTYEDAGTDPSRLGELHTQIRSHEERTLLLGGVGAAALAVFGITFLF